MLLVGVENSTPFSVMSCWSASGGWSGPVVVKLEPSVERAGDVAVGVVEGGVGVVGRRVLDLVVLQLGDEVAVADLVAAGRRGEELEADGPQDHGHEHEDRPAGPALVGPEAAAAATLTGGRGGALGTHAPSLDGAAENPCQGAVR